VPAGQPDGVLLLDKPAGYSSTQAVSRCKRLLTARKAGHTGTLDPFATGLLPLVFGEATKFSRFLIDAAKSYRATLKLGVETSTGDPEGEIIASRPVSVDSAKIAEVLAIFHGFRDQIPPMHSAVRIGGKRLYQLARDGIEIDRPARRIEIQDLQMVSLQGDELVVSVTCSKGTYVRTLAVDIGAALGCGAYLTALRRTSVGRFALERAVGIEELERLGVEGARARLLDVEVLVLGLPRRDSAEADALRFTQGQVVDCPGAPAGAEIALYGPGGRFLGVGRCESDGRLAPLRLMATGESPKLPDFA
jgi:tRNA pseudouridine55 synthase